MKKQVGLFLSLFLISCGGGGGGSANSSNRPSPAIVYLWNSSTANNGNLGGVSGGTAICQNDASGITFNTTVSTHRAVLFTGSNDPRNYFANSPVVKKPDGSTIANTYSVFWDSSVNTLQPVGGGSAIGYWTGFNGDTCSDWTNGSSGEGDIGSRDFSDTTRYSYVRISCANTGVGVLCISY